MESQRIASGPLGFVNLFQLIKNGIWPVPGDNTRWDDRLIHVVGGTLILLTLGAGLVMLVIEGLKGTHQPSLRIASLCAFPALGTNKKDFGRVVDC
jgi:hypothetical protein